MSETFFLIDNKLGFRIMKYKEEKEKPTWYFFLIHVLQKFV